MVETKVGIKGSKHACMYISLLTLLAAQYATGVIYDRSNENLTDITTILISSYPVGTTEAHMQGNKFNVIPGDYFKDLPSIEILDLSLNNISQISPHAFSNVPSIQRLYLSENQLQVIQPNMWTNLTNLEYLYLDKNLIDTVVPYSFHGLTGKEFMLIDSVVPYSFHGVTGKEFMSIDTVSTVLQVKKKMPNNIPIMGVKHPDP